MKKKAMIGIVIVLVLCGGYFIGSGFWKNGTWWRTQANG